MSCPCAYPLLIKYDGIMSITFPLDVFEANDIVRLPSITYVTDDSGDWVRVQWKEQLHDDVKDYVVNDHIVLAGCDEGQTQCDTKDIYAVLHPASEWDEYHIIDIDKLKEKLKRK